MTYYVFLLTNNHAMHYFTLEANSVDDAKQLVMSDDWNRWKRVWGEVPVLLDISDEMSYYEERDAFDRVCGEIARKLTNEERAVTRSGMGYIPGETLKKSGVPMKFWDAFAEECMNLYYVEAAEYEEGGIFLSFYADYCPKYGDDSDDDGDLPDPDDRDLWLPDDDADKLETYQEMAHFDGYLGVRELNELIPEITGDDEPYFYEDNTDWMAWILYRNRKTYIVDRGEDFWRWWNRG